jgi:hypothetical protein
MAISGASIGEHFCDTRNKKMKRTDQEWWSKLTDGLLAALILFLLWLIVMLVIKPVKIAFGTPGLLVYALGLLGIAMYCFQQALVYLYSESLRAWYGIAGGFLAWSVLLVSTNLGYPFLAGPASAVLLIMLALVVFVMWRSYLPLGARFFFLTFLLNWGGYLVMQVEPVLSRLSPVFYLAYRATGVLAVLVAVFALVWVLFRSRRRIQRISGALAIWFLISLAISIFHGRIF